MPRERTFWMVLASLIVVGLVAGLFGQRAGIRQLTLAPGAPTPTPPAVRERIWREARFEPVASVKAGPGALLEMPTLLRVDRRGDLYVLDSGRPAVVKLSPEGRLLATYQDPSVGNPTDVAVGEGEAVWICDPDHGKVAVFTAGGRLDRSFRLDPAAGRLTLDPEGGFVATSLAGGDGLFRRFSGKGEPKSSFGALFQEELQTAVAADGWIVPASPGVVIYPFRNAGLLISYSVDGRLRFFRQTIDPLPLPKIRVDAAGRQIVVAGTPVTTVSGSVAGDELYLLSMTDAGKALDVYGAADGSYRYSMKPPELDARYVVLTEDLLYSASARGVTVWRR